MPGFNGRAYVPAEVSGGGGDPTPGPIVDENILIEVATATEADLLAALTEARGYMGRMAPNRSVVVRLPEGDVALSATLELKGMYFPELYIEGFGSLSVSVDNFDTFTVTRNASADMDGSKAYDVTLPILSQDGRLVAGSAVWIRLDDSTFAGGSLDAAVTTALCGCHEVTAVSASDFTFRIHVHASWSGMDALTGGAQFSMDYSVDFMVFDFPSRALSTAPGFVGDCLIRVEDALIGGLDRFSMKSHVNAGGLVVGTSGKIVRWPDATQGDIGFAHTGSAGSSFAIAVRVVDGGEAKLGRVYGGCKDGIVVVTEGGSANVRSVHGTAWHGNAVESYDRAHLTVNHGEFGGYFAAAFAGHASSLVAEFVAMTHTFPSGNDVECYVGGTVYVGDAVGSMVTNPAVGVPSSDGSAVYCIY